MADTGISWSRQVTKRDYIKLITYLSGTVSLDDPFFIDVVHKAILGVKNYEALLIRLQCVWDDGRFTGIDEANEGKNG